MSCLARRSDWSAALAVPPIEPTAPGSISARPSPYTHGCLLALGCAHRRTTVAIGIVDAGGVTVLLHR